MKGKELKNQTEKITLKDGEEYTLEFTLNALVEIEELFGSISEVYKIFEDFNLKKLRGLLYAGLVEHHPEMTERKVGSLLDMSDLTNVVETLSKAFSKAFPDAEGEGTKK